MLSCRVLSPMDRFPKPCVAGSNPAGATLKIAAMQGLLAASQSSLESSTRRWWHSLSPRATLLGMFVKPGLAHALIM